MEEVKVLPPNNRSFVKDFILRNRKLTYWFITGHVWIGIPVMFYTLGPVHTFFISVCLIWYFSMLDDYEAKIAENIE